MIVAYTTLFGKYEERGDLEALSLKWRIIFKLILYEYYMRAWTGCNKNKIKVIGGFL
jgi:hypothetical protein